MKIVLIGFMGAGKSTVARGLSARLSVPVYEMDALIVEHSSYPDIPAIFAAEGEAGFRALETEVARSLEQVPVGVISTGGGVVMRDETIEALQRDASVVWLRASFETLAKRVEGDTTRPLFRDLEQARALFTRRQPLYERAASFVVEVEEKTPEELVTELLAGIPGGFVEDAG
jgi:shikimate kinase